MKLPQHVSESFKRLNPDLYKDHAPGVCSPNPQPAEGSALDCDVQGKTEGVVVPKRRARIRFVVHSTRPADWDNLSFKGVQDLLVEVGILDGDEWNILQGSVESRKVRSKAEEGTEIEINFYQD